MKRLFFIAPLVLLLVGCGVQETYETVTDEAVQSVMASPQQILVDLPGDALAPVLKTEGEQVYLSQDYEIIIETRAAGDINATVEALSGFHKEDVTLVETVQADTPRYEFVWACAGENGDRLGRAVVLDDGKYHYCMSVLKDAQETVSQISWEDVFTSFRIAPGTAGTDA